MKEGNKMCMSNKTEGIIAILAAFFVLLSAMLNPKISVGLAIVFLVVLSAYKLYQSKTKWGDKNGKRQTAKNCCCYAFGNSNNKCNSISQYTTETSFWETILDQYCRIAVHVLDNFHQLVFQT